MSISKKPRLKNSFPDIVKVTKFEIEIQKALLILDERFNELGGSAFFGPLENPEAILLRDTVRCYKNAALCFNFGSNKAFLITGAIYNHWKELGGEKWGIPNTDEMTCPDGIGKFNHFNNNTASIYWSPSTGAHGIWGPILVKWAELGWERSYLGYPTSKESDIIENGRFNSFEHGEIYWWPDVGPIDLNEIIVQYKGIACFDENDLEKSLVFDTEADEPYVTIGINGPNSSNTFQTQIYQSVDAGDTRSDLIELYRGKPLGIILGVVLEEHDTGDPNRYLNEITQAFVTNHEIGKVVLGAFFGEAVVKLAEKFDKEMPKIAKSLNDLFNTGDDKIGVQIISYNLKQLVLLAIAYQELNYKDISYKFQTNHLTEADADYTIYFNVVRA